MGPSYHDVRAGWIVYHGAAPAARRRFLLSRQEFRDAHYDHPADGRSEKSRPRRAAIEAAGYDGAMTMENAHHPVSGPWRWRAVETERVELLTAVAIAFPRSPMVCANAAWDLQVASGGRFVLGLGPQIRAHNVRRFSVPWSAPAAACANTWNRCARYGAPGKAGKSSITRANTTSSAS